MDASKRMQYHVYSWLNIADELVWTVFHAPGECWFTEMELILSPFPDLHCHKTAPGSWCKKTNKRNKPGGKMIISTAIRTRSKLSGINAAFTLFPMPLIVWWFSIRQSLYIHGSGKWRVQMECCVFMPSMKLTVSIGEWAGASYQ